LLLQLNLLVDQTLHISIGAPHVMHYSLFSCVGWLCLSLTWSKHVVWKMWPELQCTTLSS